MTDINQWGENLYTVRVLRQNFVALPIIAGLTNDVPHALLTQRQAN